MLERMYDGEGIYFAFNIWNFASAQAVMDAARRAGQNVILQTSAGIYEAMPKEELRTFVTGYARKLGISVWLNLDHCRNEQMVREAMDNGWDSVMLDMSQRSLAENIEAVNRLHAYVQGKEHRPYVEAEVGILQGTEEDIASIESHIAPQADIDEFVAKASFDALAVAFGNAHGTYRTKPELHYDLVAYAVSKSGKPFVVHGASGLSEDALKKLAAIRGVRKINISTDLKLAARQGYMKAEENGWMEEKGFQPARVQQCVYEAVRDKAMEKMLMLKGDR